MNFKARIWKQGNSKLITIPVDVVKEMKLEAGSRVSVALKPTLNVVCDCGKIYQNNSKADHKCIYYVLDTETDAQMLATVLASKRKSYQKGVDDEFKRIIKILKQKFPPRFGRMDLRR